MKFEVLDCENCPLFYHDYDYGEHCGHPNTHWKDDFTIDTCPLQNDSLELVLLDEATRLKRLKELEEKRKAEIAKVTRPEEYWWICTKCGTIQPDSYDEGCDHCGVGNQFLVPHKK